ncbi:MAG: hypothetical protein IE928_05990 [Gammaproteobacteria bacterium]|nr:hypothetical protein [Gammaproteobacteria bacterium]
MKTIIALATSLLVSSPVFVQAAAMDDVKKAIFAGTSGIADNMQGKVAELLSQRGWQANAQGELMQGQCGVVPHKTEVLDLNGDGKKEVILMVGNECSSGKIGQQVYLFSQSADGKVERQLGFSASGYRVLKAKAEGAWPDLLFLGTGECQPVWRHQAASGRYTFNHLYEAKPQACKVGQMQVHGNN